MVYYGLALNATNLGGDVYVNFVLIQLVDWPGIIICLFILDPWGRKLTTSLGFIIAGLGSIASGLVADIDGELLRSSEMHAYWMGVKDQSSSAGCHLGLIF